jgi:nitrite reductase/ring-hydroxylating ferredoxin subunit
MAILVVVAFTWPANPAITSYEWVNLAAVEDLPFGEPVVVREHRLYLVRLESGEVLALKWRDPRLGCTVPWRPDFEFMGKTGWFRNPCHGQTYDLTGHCVLGPCARDLDRYAVAIVNGEVFVDVRNLLCSDDGYSGAPVRLGSATPFIYGCLPPGSYGGTPPLP